MDSVPRDSASRVLGPRLLGGRGHKVHSGSALVLSLPRDRDKEGVVRSRTLVACTLHRCDRRFRGRQDFPALARVGGFLSVAESLFLGSVFRSSVVSPPAGGDRSAASLGLSVAGLVRDAPPLSCSLIPNPQAVFLDAFRIPWGDLGIYALPPFLSSDGWWLQSGRPQSLHDSGRPPLAGGGVVRRPSPFSWFSRFTSVVARVFSVSPVPGSQSALHSVFTLQDLVRTTYREIFCVPWKFLEVRRT